MRDPLPGPFPRQFFAAPYPVPGFEGWGYAALGPLHVYAHPDLGLVRAAGDGGVEVVLLGFALDPDHPELKDQEIAGRAAAGRTLRDVIAATVDLAGRWVLLALVDGEVYALNDPCGLRTVHYTATEAGPWLASNPALLGRLVPLRPAPYAHQFWESAYRRERLEPWIPSGTTLWDGVGHLVPNHSLQVGTGRQVRYWPVHPLPRHSMEHAVPRVAALLRRLVQAGAARFPLSLPLTGGWDSRMLLAAARPIADQLFVYTLMYRDLNDASADVRIPREMLAFTGLPHHAVECMRPAPAEFMDTYRGNADIPNDDWGRIAWGMYRGYPADRVCLKGNCAEIARNGYFSNLRADPSPRAIAEQEFGSLPFAVEALERWMGPAREACAAAGMELLDLVYWEHLMGSWQARSQLEWDVAQEAYTPYNHRPLLELMLGVPERDRDKPRARLSHALLRELWPELARWPVNPLPPGPRLRLALRTLLVRTGVHAPLRKAWRSARAALRGQPR
jgi:hypothetical protein